MIAGGATRRRSTREMRIARLHHADERLLHSRVAFELEKLAARSLYSAIWLLLLPRTLHCADVAEPAVSLMSSGEFEAWAKLGARPSAAPILQRSSCPPRARTGATRFDR
jgi:hypothetical protein